MQSSPSPRRVPLRPLGVLVVALLTACNAQSPTGLVASGKELVAKGDHKAAVIQFKSALQSDPASREARLLLGRSQLEVGEIDGAIAELTRALNEGAENADVLPSLSRALVLAGEYRKLVTTYGELKLSDKAAQAALRTNVASAWGALGDRAKTEAAVADALAADPTYGPAKILKARILAGGKQFEQASAIVDEVLSRDAKYYEAWLLRGELRDFASNDLKGAGEAYRKAVELAPAYVPAQSALIGLLVRQRDVPGAKAQADRLRAVRPNHPYTVLIDAHLAFLDRKPERARELVQLLLRAFPDHQGILILAGAVEAQLGATIQAAAFFGKVLQLNPAMDIARRNLAEAEIRLGQPAKALETLKPMLSAESPKADALALAGEAELRQGNAAAAEKYYLRAAKADPDNVRVQTAAAMTRLWYGDGSEALAELQGLAAKSPDTYADEALLAARMKRREFDAALGVIDAMAKKQPGKAQHAELRGRVHLARRDLPAARQAFEQAVQMDPGLFAAVASLAQIDELDKQPQKAVARLEENIKANPKNSMAMLAVAEIKERQGAAVADVRKVLADAVAAAPASSEPRLKQIDYLLRKRQFKDALAAAQDAVAALPADAQILDAVGQAQLQAGGAEQALTAFRRLAAAVPNSPTPYMRLAEVYMLLGKRDQAEVAINKALEIEPTLAAAQTSLIDLLVTSNRQKSAAEYIDRVKKARPTAAAGYLLEATYHVRLRNADAAVGALREGLAKTSDPEIAAKLLGLLIQSGKTAEAEKFGASWLRQHPGDLAFEYQMSSSDIARGDFKSAEQRLRRVLAAAPNNVAALNNMAWVLIKTGGAGAVQFAQRAVDLVPDRPPLMDTLAQALAADKQVPAALDMQKRAVGLAPDDNGLRLNLARLALQAGDKALAKQELERLQKLGATFPAQAEVEKLLRGL